ncbi:hypothetical protein [Arthrobacter agilis]|uniref:hypothetical protein n=1 Tax=Arthrobacter agilis TaxID=37921 RepID=UPI00277D33B7|nr:hypothetical protein [Arthrobacter agilis]MDQ0733607.1 hypothetical protein [Arthrobacter agilis]
MGRTGRRRPVRRRAVHAAAAVAAVLVLAGCVQLPAAGPAAPTAPADLPPSEELAGMDVRTPEDLGLPGDATSIAVLAADRSAYCAISTKQGRIFDNPVDPLMAGGEKDDNELEVDAAYCELAAYPAPAEAADDCNGTNLGFKGGTVLLTVDSFTYGGCRIGLTPMEAEFAAGAASGGGPIAGLPLLERGQAVELRGFRCGFGQDGMICSSLESGKGFVANRETVTEFG